MLSFLFLVRTPNLLSFLPFFFLSLSFAIFFSFIFFCWNLIKSFFFKRENPGKGEREEGLLLLHAGFLHAGRCSNNLLAAILSLSPYWALSSAGGWTRRPPGSLPAPWFYAVLRKLMDLVANGCGALRVPRKVWLSGPHHRSVCPSDPAWRTSSFSAGCRAAPFPGRTSWCRSGGPKRSSRPTGGGEALWETQTSKSLHNHHIW